MILVYITCKDFREGEKISKHLLKKKLVACTNLFPIKSFYWWKKKIVKDNEVVLIAKTLKENFSKVEKAVKKVHSYDIPCIIAFKIGVSKEFFDWVKKEVR